MACGEGDKGSPPAQVKRPPARLEFEGYVYVQPNATDLKILQRVRTQTRSVFTALRKGRVMVSRREVESTDTDALKKEAVSVVDNATGFRTSALRVRYRYVARPEIAHDLEERKELSLAVLQRDEDDDAERVLRECTSNSEHDKGFASAVALVFDASLDSCKTAVQDEQAAIDAARAALSAAPGSPNPLDDSVIPREESERLYLRIKVTLDRKKHTPGELMPRYAPLGEKEEAPSPPEQEDDGPEPARSFEPTRAVIVDPDLAPPVRQPEEKPGEPEVVLSPGGGKSESPPSSRIPDLMGPRTAASQSQRRPAVEPNHGERFEIPFETLMDPKFMIVWLSLLLAYPILRTETKKKRED